MRSIERSGYAMTEDLESPEVVSVLAEMETFQSEFVAATRSIWTPRFPFSGECLYGWSRRWEYPYCWLNLPARLPAKVLDAGSGITFFPFFLEQRGFEVHCADVRRGLSRAFDAANQALKSRVSFRTLSISRLEQSDNTFDAVVCVSVLEHVSDRLKAVREMARVLRPGGRLVLTCDISLDRCGSILPEDFAVMLEELRSVLLSVYPLDLHRPPGLLTTNMARATEPWCLPWRTPTGWLARAIHRIRFSDEFRSIAVVGSVWIKPDRV